MKLSKSDHPSKLIYKRVDDFQRELATEVVEVDKKFARCYRFVTR